MRMIGSLLLLLLASCGSAEKKAELASADSAIAIVENTAQPKAAAPTVDTSSFFGSYVGDFDAVDYEDIDASYSNRISLFLDSIEGSTLYGHSVVAGNLTPFSGGFSHERDGIIRASVAEPGSGKYDGKFTFELDTVNETLKGEWLANNRDLDVPHRKFALTRQRFVYMPNAMLDSHFVGSPLTDIQEFYSDSLEALSDDIIKHNASTTLLKSKDIENTKRGDLEVIRNTIYARHGYSFRNRRMRYIFDAVQWYVPVSTDIRGQLTELEKKNIALLKRYEEHAEKYYDYFGR